MVTKEERKSAYLKLHFSVFLWGFTAILGKLIVLREAPLVWYRILITCVSMLFLPTLWRQIRKMGWKDALRAAGIGCIVCMHWLCFYGSIKASSASVALICLSTTSFLTAIIEPIFFRVKFKYYEILLGMLIIPGIYLIRDSMVQFGSAGIILGLLAALGSAIFTTLNKKLMSRQEALPVTFAELSGGFIFLSLLMPFYLHFFPAPSLVPSHSDWWYLILLALACTTLPFVISLQALRHLSAFSATLTVNLEPIYGIIMAIFFLNEDRLLDVKFYIGTAIILGAVFLQPVMQRFFIGAGRG